MAKVISQLPSGGSVPKHNNLLGLNEGDYLHLTQFEKAKLDGIQSGAEVNVNTDWNAVSGDAQLLNKPTEFPPSTHTHTKSQITDFAHTHPISDVTGLPTALDDLQLNKEDKANKNIANGYAGLDSSGKIIPTQLPALAITDTFVVNSQAEMLALVAEVGDVAVRTDLNKSFILRVTGASTLANWQELLSPTSVDQTIIDGSTNAVSSNAVFDGLATKFNTPTGLTTNYLPKWNGSGFGNSGIFDDGTNIGIGTTNPTANLTVKGAYSVGSSIPADWALLSAGRMGVAKNNKSLYFDIFNGYAEVSTYDWNLGQAYPMVFQANGGNSMFGTNVDNGVDRVQVNGTISASPATTANQVVVKSQLDAESDSQIEISANSNTLDAWNKKTILFTANCTITVPATLLSQFGFVFRTLAGVTVTWAITAPFTWETTPTTTPEKTTGSFMRRGNTNTILLDF